MADLAVKIGDEYVPLTACDWIFQDTCGCPTGVLSASHVGRTTASEDQAWREIYETKREVDKAKKRGETCTLITHKQWSAEFYERFRIGGHTCATAEPAVTDIARAKIIAVLADILEEVAGVRPAEIAEDKRFEEDLDVDSLSQVEVVVAMEERFDVKVSDEEWPTLTTVATAVDYVVKALAKK